MSESDILLSEDSPELLFSKNSLNPSSSVFRNSGVNPHIFIETKESTSSFTSSASRRKKCLKQWYRYHNRKNCYVALRHVLRHLHFLSTNFENFIFIKLLVSHRKSSIEIFSPLFFCRKNEISIELFALRPFLVSILYKVSSQLPLWTGTTWRRFPSLSLIFTKSPLIKIF